MIRYDLVCHQGHAFESWFRDSAGFDALRDAGHLECPHCGSAKVGKAIMAPSVAKAPKGPDLAESRRTRAERSFEYVGDAFAERALAMHRGEIPDAAIRGEASPRQARELLDAGVPIAPYLGDRSN
jgi:hypothetical protein